MKTRLLSLFCLAALVGTSPVGWRIEAQSSNSPTDAPLRKPDLVTVEVPSSASATSIKGEVEKMIQGGADAEVIKAFIQNWTTQYHVTADEILELHNAGASTGVLTTLIRRSTELTAQAAAVKALSRPSLVTTNPPAGTSSGAAAPLVIYPYPSSYPAYTYSYLYPDTIWPSYSYRYWPSPFAFSFYYGWPRYRNYYWPHSYHRSYRNHGFHHRPPHSVGWNHSGFGSHPGRWSGHGTRWTGQRSWDVFSAGHRGSPGFSRGGGHGSGGSRGFGGGRR